MHVFTRIVEVSSSEKFQLINITGYVEKIVRESNVKNGICLIFVPHATAALIANENETGLIRDILNQLRELIPPNKPWLHNRIDDNAHAHIASAIIGAHLVFPILNGQLLRGTWQEIFLVEMDGPRSSRKVVVQVLGE
ncbi:MAG: secondary thiamine-phosphate synthase enzyme YjbQ [Infirmifilum sp.]|jgi:secondary thiamine-phosphate synthase enzyme|uniref:Secondary thiamine-phosphate synthase enzyme n=1 Tax=Infirmifilum uzonense TaxID=1550241 RepID=A0A0F7FJC3_9CREN|nr:secondary thiamine-phosphate synthase enzyme YjbQ [Infirmifilum uzonense]AKG38982.1 hypothetical protein MA03_06590 [Infirmifilum uzonense]